MRTRKHDRSPSRRGWLLAVPAVLLLAGAVLLLLRGTGSAADPGSTPAVGASSAAADGADAPLSNQPAANPTGLGDFTFEMSDPVSGVVQATDQGQILVLESPYRVVDANGADALIHYALLACPLEEALLDTAVTVTCGTLYGSADQVWLDAPYLVGGDVWVPTPYATLHISDAWADCLAVTRRQTGDGCEVLFTGLIDERAYPLFTIVLGAGSGTEAGATTGPDGSLVPVWVQFHPLDEYPDLQDGELTRMQAMQEDLNYLLDELTV